MISIFDDDNIRQSVTWNGIEFNDPDVDRFTIEGNILHSVAFSTPIVFASEPIDDIVKAGGGVEYQNPRVGSRVLQLRGELKAPTESALALRIRNLQEAFHPLYLQTAKANNRAGTQTWPPPSGAPSWIRELPLKFTRVLPRTWSPTTVPSGKLPLQYHVAPMALPDPIRTDHLQGVGAEYTAEFLVFYGGRSFGQTENTFTRQRHGDVDLGQGSGVAHLPVHSRRSRRLEPDHHGLRHDHGHSPGAERQQPDLGHGHHRHRHAQHLPQRDPEPGAVLKR